MRINNICESNKIVDAIEYLQLCGVENTDVYLKPTYNDFKIFNYINIERAIKLFNYHYEKLSPTYLIVDCDVDGLCSAIQLYQYMKSLNSKWDIKFLLHTTKQRSVEDDNIYERIKSDNRPFCIISDAGTNSKDRVKELHNNYNVDFLILDHHDILTPIDDKDGVLVSNQIGDVDRNGSGAVVVNQFIQSIENNINMDYFDIVALSIISDSMNVSSIQNRIYLYYGLFNNSNINKNKFLCHCIDKWIGKVDFTQKDVAFSIVPKFNSVIRKGEIDEIQKLILAFIGRYDFDKACEICEKAHNHQNYVVTKFTNNYYKNNNFDNCVNDKFNIVISDDLQANYSGLIAGKIMNKNNKPTIVGKADNDGLIIGSLRSPIPIENVFECAKFVGHPNAAGAFIYDLDGFINEVSNTFVGSLEPHIDVLQSYTIKSLPRQLFGLYEPYNKLWGQGIPNPKFYIYNITVIKDNISIIGKNKNTIRIKKDDITFLFFNLSDIDKEKLECYNKFRLNIVGELNINKWNGKKYPQIIVDKFEVKEYNKEERSLEDLL